MRKGGMAAVALAGICSVSMLVSFCGCSALMDPTDYVQWSTTLVESTMLSAIIVEKNNLGTGAQSRGSGVVFYETNTHYYALTNNHVVYKAAGESITGYEAIDCFDNSYLTAKVVYADADYDLAVISFQKKSGVNLHVSPLSQSNAARISKVALISNPKGRHNATTFGSVIRYEKMELVGSSVAESNVQFEIMAHDCFSLDGSSGGALYNTNSEIVGIHYACGYASGGEFVEGYAIPVAMVRAFLLEAEIQSQLELGV